MKLRRSDFDLAKLLTFFRSQCHLDYVKFTSLWISAPLPVVRSLDSQSRGSWFKITGWLQVRLSHSSFRGRSNEYLNV